MRTIAEGVETLDQLKRLRELGAHMGQGFYFSPPLSTEAAERLLSEASRRQKLTENVALADAFRDRTLTKPSIAGRLEESLS